MTIGELILLLAQFQPGRQVCIHNESHALLEPDPPFIIDVDDAGDAYEAVLIGTMSDPRRRALDRVRNEIAGLQHTLEAQELTDAQKNSVRLAIAEREAELNALPKPCTSDF